LDNGFGGDGASARAALLVKEIEHFAKRVGVRRIPKIGALAAHMDETHLFQLFQMVRKCGGGDAELLLDFTGDHSGGMGSQEQAKNLEAGLSAESGEAVGGAGDEEWIGSFHVSIFAEIRNDVKLFFRLNVFRWRRILVGASPRPWKRPAFRF
jgi:hypothetical protein